MREELSSEEVHEQSPMAANKQAAKEVMRSVVLKYCGGNGENGRHQHT